MNFMEKERLLVINEWLRARRFFNAKLLEVGAPLFYGEGGKEESGMHERDEL
jgi:hypothetical protein